MKRVIAAITLCLFCWSASSQPTQETARATAARLRAMALAVKPVDIGLDASDYAGRPWGVVMEGTSADGVTYTVVVLADGTTSLYFSTGGGILGAGSKPGVQAASTAMLTLAATHHSEMKRALSTSTPRSGRVHFYLLTAKGLLLHSAEEAALAAGKDPLSPLFHRGHAVIWQIRMAQHDSRAPS